MPQHTVFVSFALISNVFDLLQKGDQKIKYRLAMSVEMRLKGLLMCTVVCFVHTEQTAVVQLCILMLLGSKIKAVEEGNAAEELCSLLKEECCCFFQPQLYLLIF